MTKITEQCGAVWIAKETGAVGERAIWVFRVSGKSVAMPNVIGFYAVSINAAAAALSN